MKIRIQCLSTACVDTVRYSGYNPSMLTILLLKISVSVLVVLGLSCLAEYASPRLAGILAGFPTGSAITLFFIGLEQGPDFAADSAASNLTGLTAMLVFLYCYWKAPQKNNRAFAAPSALALCGYFLCIIPLRMLPHSPIFSIILTICMILLFRRLFSVIPDTTISQRQPLSARLLLLRSLCAASIILMVTACAGTVGPRWSGLFSAFPSTLFPLLLIVHATYGYGPACSVIRHVPDGLGSLMVYSLTVSLTYGRQGICAGTLLAFAAATLYILGFMALFRRQRA
ncbi:MAG: hypothetical protein PHQ23_07815 [Candidatus Wallbacteria bacterium]|nr:hypothetical protein [Candidatus Wallbacteria bacterium]